jgi:hypothetical protein
VTFLHAVRSFTKSVLVAFEEQKEHAPGRMLLQLFRNKTSRTRADWVESVLNMAEEQFQIPIHYRVEIGEEFPEQRENPNTPRWEALVEIPDEVQKTVEAKNLSLQWHAMELARTAIGKLTLINDPQFTPQARLAEKVHFDAVHRTYSAVDFTSPDFITEDNCRIWFLRKPHSEMY